MSEKYGLIADIGGTNARFALADHKGYYKEQDLKCCEFEGPVSMAKKYMEMVDYTDIKYGAFALAGPVTSDVFVPVNLPWSFSIKQLGEDLGFEKLDIYNDFAAVSMSLPHLKDKDLRRLGGKSGGTAGAAMAVIGPGTGLGAGGVIFDDKGEGHVITGEAGHSTAPARTARDISVIKILGENHDYISAEMLCSGQGLENIYRALKVLDGRSDLPERQAPEISGAALDNRCELCREALEMMMAFLGRFAGDLVLTLGAWQGVFIAGGIVNKLGDYIYGSPFRAEFEKKEKLTEVMKAVPAYVIKHPNPALVGLQASLIR
jgi:glucokinase